MKITSLVVFTKKMTVLFLMLFLISGSQILVKAQERESIGSLIQSLKSADAVVRAKASHQLGQRRSEAKPAISALIAVLGDDEPVDPRKMGTWSWHYRWRGADGPQPTSPGFQAANALGNIGKAAVKPLINELKNKSWFARMNAADALGDIEDKSSLPSLISALKAENNDDAKVEMLDAIGEMEDASTIPVLGSFIKDKVVRVRLEAVWALEEMGNSKAASYFLTAVKDNEPEVREAALCGLEEFEDEQYLPVFIEATRDENLEVRVTAYEAISDLESPKTAGIFLELLDGKDPQLIMIAVDALGDMESKKAVPKLIRILDSSEGRLKIAVIHALGDIGDKSAAIPLSKLVETAKDSDIKRMAMEAISDLY